MDSLGLGHQRHSHRPGESTFCSNQKRALAMSTQWSRRQNLATGPHPSCLSPGTARLCCGLGRMTQWSASQRTLWNIPEGDARPIQDKLLSVLARGSPGFCRLCILHTSLHAE